MNKSVTRSIQIFLFMVLAACALPLSSTKTEAASPGKKVMAKSTPQVQIHAVNSANRELNHMVPTDSSFRAYITSEDDSLLTDGWNWTCSSPAIIAVSESRSSSCSFRTPGISGKVTITARKGNVKAQYTMSVQSTESREIWEGFREELFYQYLSPSESRLEKCLKIARWLCDYATLRSTSDPDMLSLMQTHYGQYTHYAQIFAFLAEGAGIPVKLAEDDGYMWNQVEIDGQWYNLDTASMDRHDSVGSYEYGYFLVSDALFWRKGPRMSGVYCSSTRFDYQKTSPEDSPWASGEWKKS